MRVGVEATLVAHHGVALCAGVETQLVIPSCHQVSVFADGAQLAAGHGSDLRHRVRGGGDIAAVRGHRRRSSTPVATQIHLEVPPGSVAFALRSLRCSMLGSVMGG